jgi:hypothetical protein
MSPARASAPATVSFFSGRVPPWSLPQPFIPPVPPLPYVLPGTVGYLGSPGALTPYSPPGSGLPGAGALPDDTWQWESYGIRNDNASITLDHVMVYGAIFHTGENATITNSVISGGTGTEFYCYYNDNPSNPTGVLSFTDSTFGWLDTATFPSGFDTATLHDNTGDPAYLVTRCDLSGTPQGLNPGVGSQIINCYIHGLFENDPGADPTHLDGIFNQGAENVLIQGCYIDAGPITNPSVVTACLFFQGSPNFSGCVVTGNYLLGGSYTFYNENALGVVVTGNTFAGATFGDTNLVAPGTVGTWTGNVHPDGSVVPAP